MEAARGKLLVARRLLPAAAIVVTATLGSAWTIASVLVRRLERMELEQVAKPGKTIDIDGLLLHYVEQGEGHPVILIHGLGGSTYNLRHTIPTLAQHFRVLAVDMLGFGYSGRPPDADYSLTAQSRLILKFMDRLNIPVADVIGHSLGGMVAMRLAASYPQRVCRLVLVASPTIEFSLPALVTMRLLEPLWRTMVAFWVTNRPLRERIWRNGYYDPSLLTPEVIENYLAPSRIKGNASGLTRLLCDMGRDLPLSPALVTQPTLILWGENDRPPTSPEHGRHLASVMPDARLMIIPRAGHMLLEEQPQVANGAIIDFLLADQPVHATLAG